MMMMMMMTERNPSDGVNLEAYLWSSALSTSHYYCILFLMYTSPSDGVMKIKNKPAFIRLKDLAKTYEYTLPFHYNRTTPD